MNKHSSKSQRGFTLIEAMVALVIVGFGMLVVVGMQMMLNRNAEVARERSEATRLAEEKLEALRSFTTIAPKAGQLAWNDLASGADAPATGYNISYARTWTLGGATVDSKRDAQVLVSWTDRGGVADSVQVNTVISKTDPADSGALGFPLPANTTLKQPKNRNLNIPIQAKDLGNGSSAVNLATFTIIFNNASGYVVKRCTSAVNTAGDLLTAGCTDYPAYIVAGYVSGTPSPVTGLNLTGITPYLSHGGTECVIGNATDQNTGVLIPNYKYYLCVVKVPNSGDSWSGKIKLTGMSSGTDYLVCRFQYPATAGVSSNALNMQPYVNVTESLDQQNYYVTTANSCPTVSDLATTLHQNCRSNNPYSNSNRATDCPAAPD